MDEELHFHLRERVDDLVDSGISRAEAERRARVEFGGIEITKDHCRDARGIRLMDDMRQDLRYAWRTLVKSPAFTTVAILTLALGIGAVTIIYSIVYNVVIDPLPYKDADRLVNVFVQDAQSSSVRTAFPVAEFLDLRDQSRVFEDVVGTLGQGMRYETRDSVAYLRAVWVTPNFFDFMGLEPLLGRTITAEDGNPGAAQVAVLRYRAWLAYFGGDPGVIGKTVILNGESRTIIGVMPKRFTWHAADLWIPGPLDLSAANAQRTFRNFQARLRKGVTSEEAEAELNVIAARRARDHPKEYPQKFRIRVVNIIEFTVGPFTAVLYTSLAAVGLLLLIACCNVANMLLARATTREREMMIRVALGAGRARLLRQLMVESLLLASSGAALGCLVAYVGIGALVARLPQGPLPGEVDIALNAPVLFFSLIATAVSALLFGITPSLYAARRDLVDGLKAAAPAIATGRGTLRNGLVVAEIALSLVLVLSAGLLMRSFLSVLHVDPGFRPDNLLVVAVAFPPQRYTTPPERQRFYQESLQRIGSLPQVIAAAATSGIPPFTGGPPSTIEIPGATMQGRPTASVQLCTADYFRALQIPFIRGSGFSDLTTDEKPRVAVINETLERLYFSGQDPLGKRLTLVPATEPADPMRDGVFEIVGVVKDVKNTGLRDPAEAQVYLPWSGVARGSPVLIVRTTVAPTNSVADIRRELTLVDRQVAILQARPLTEELDRLYYAEPRFSLLVLGLFAIAGTLLVAIGVFSVMGYTVSRQRKEIAVRMALGASRADVFRVVMRRGAQLIIVGGVVGAVTSLATNRLLMNQLWNVSPYDPLTLAAAMSLIAIIALAACYIPARRAMLVDPIGALREQ